MDNYTQIQNWLLAKLYGDETLTQRELRVLLYLIRKLQGFHKTSDKIPYGQIAEATGIDRRSVIRIMKSLEEKQWISVKRKDKCINIIRLKGGGMAATRGGGKNSNILVAQLPPSKENQKSVTSGTHSFRECDPREKEIISVSELNKELGEEYE